MRRSDYKLEDLSKVVGKETSENFSPTLRAKLVSVNEYKGVCTMEVVPSPYKLSGEYNHMAGMRYEAPVYRIWNAFFF